MYCPILILHDRDDETISFELGKKVSVKIVFHPISKHQEVAWKNEVQLIFLLHFFLG